MKSLLTIPYIALQNVVRNRQKTLTSFLGIVLAVTLIFGEVLALEFQSGAVLEYQVEKLDYHIHIDGGSVSPLYYNEEDPVPWFRSLEKNFSSINGVKERRIDIRDFWVNDYQNSVGIRFNDVNFTEENIFAYWGRIGNLSSSYGPPRPEKGSIVLPARYATKGGVGIGDQVNISFISYEVETINMGNDSWEQTVTIDIFFWNQTFVVGGLWGEKDEYKYNDRWDEGPGLPWEQVIFNGWDLLNIMETISDSPDLPDGSFLTFRFTYRSVFDESLYHGKSMREAEEDVGSATDQFEEIVGVQQKVPGNYIYADYQIDEAFSRARSSMDDSRAELLALSLPLVYFGVYVGYMGVELFISERRRELGMLKVRGATSRQVASLLFLESALTGAFAGLVGVLLAAAGTRFFMQFTSAANYMDVSWYQLGIETAWLLAGILVGMVLMVSASVRLFRKMAKLEAGELLSKFSDQEKREYNRLQDLKILVVTAVLVVVMGFSEEVGSALSSLDNVFTDIISWLLFDTLQFFVVLFAPFVIIFAVVRLATRGSRRFYESIAGLVSRISGEMGYIIRKNVVTGERRVTNVTTVFSLLVAFLILISTFYHAEIDMEERYIKTQIGSDVVVTFQGGSLSREEREIFEEQLENSSDVAAYSIITRTDSRLLGDDWPVYIQIYLIDARNYSSVAYMDKDIFEEGEKDGISSLASGSVFLSKELAKEFDVSKGDRITTGYTYYDEINHNEVQVAVTNFTSAGVLRTIPGMYNDYKEDDDEYDDEFWDGIDGWWILADRTHYRSVVQEWMKADPNASYYMSLDSMNTRYLIKLKPGADHGNFANQLEELENPEVKELRIRSEELHELKEEPYPKGFVLELRTELWLLVFISLLTSGGIVYINSFEKRKEIASFMLKGTTRRQSFELQLGESLVIVIYSFIVGVAVGLVAAWSWIFMFNSIESGRSITRSYWPSFSMFPVIGLMILIVLVASALLTWRMQRTDLTKFIKWGG